MPKLFLDELYTRTLAAEGYVDSSRRPRSPLREAHVLQSLRARDQSASSSENRSSSSRRSSIFSKRPKSSMTTRSTKAGHGEDLRPSSTTMDKPVMPSETDVSRSRFLFGRGQKTSKSSGSKVRANSPTDIYDDGYVPRQRESKHKRELSDSRGIPKDLFSDFRALRRGHRTAVVGPAREFPAEERKAEPTISQRGPAPLRPKRPDERSVNDQLLTPEAFGMQPLRQIRSAEQFSPGTPPPQTAGPPKRPLHRPPPLNPALFPPTANYNLSHISTGSTNDEWDRLLPLYDNRSSFDHMDYQISSMRSVPQAEAIPDQIKSPSFNPPLEQVPEEPEGTLSSRHSKDVTHLSSIRHAKSSPMLSRKTSKSSHRKRSEIPPVFKTKERPISQGSDTLGDPTSLSNHYQKAVNNPDITDMIEPSTRDTTPSWEDDIDYCYEHAAEANCDFDWDNASRYDESDHDDIYVDDGPYTYALMHKDISRKQCTGSILSSNESEGYQLPNQVYKVPSKDALPELEYRSSHSTSTNSVSLLTPLDKFSFPSPESRNSRRLSGKDAALPQLLFVDSRSESQANQLYDEVLAKVDGSPPAVPPRSESRIEKMIPHEKMRKNVAVPLLPTPPPSADQSPVIPDEEPPRHDLHINTIVAALRRPLESPVSPQDHKSPEYPPPLPPKPSFQFFRRSQEKPSDDIPRLVTRGRANTLSAAKAKLFDTQSQLQEWQSVIPRSNSETSVVTAIAASQPPTPPSGSPPTSRLPTLPGVVSSGAPVLRTPTPTPAFENAYFVPPRSTSFSLSEMERPQTQMHRKGSSDPVSSKPNTPPLTPLFRTQHTVRPSRSSYSLFPQAPKSPGPGPSTLKSAKSMNFPAALRSAPLNGSFPTKPFSPRFEQFQQDPPASPKNAYSRSRPRISPQFMP